MPKLFDRKVEVTVGNLKFTDLNVVFSVSKSLKPEPNTCELSIYNLTPEHQAELEAIAPKGSAPATRGIPCRIDAGYKDALSTIWLGDLRTVESKDEDPDTITHLTSGDGEKSWKHARLHVGYGPKTPVDTALRAIARALGVGEGNLSTVVSKLRIGGSAIWPTGKVLSGAASKQLVEIAKSADLEVSIQDGALQFLDRGKPLGGTALKLTRDTGLEDVPTVDNEGIMTCTVRMIPDIRVGGVVVIDTERLKGNYRVLQADWHGELYGEAWGATLKGEAY